MVDTHQVTQSRLALVALYFGEPPPYLFLTLRSMAANPDVDWLLFTDFQIRPAVPANVRHTYLSFSQIREKIQGCFDFEVALPSAYKLCDLKPAYGEIFAHDLAGYEWWGHCDLDLVFGDLLRVIPSKVFERFDKAFWLGWLSLYRNIPAMNGLYRTESDGLDYRTAFQSPSTLMFDEVPGFRRILEASGIPIWDEVSDSSFDVDCNVFWTRPGGASSGSFLYTWEDGKVFEYAPDGTCREGALIHLQKRSMESPRRAVRESDEYFILPDRFVAKTGPVDTSDFRRADPSGVRRARFYTRRLMRRGRLSAAYRRRLLLERIGAAQSGVTPGTRTQARRTRRAARDPERR